MLGNWARLDILPHVYRFITALFVVYAKWWCNIYCQVVEKRNGGGCISVLRRNANSEHKKIYICGCVMSEKQHPMLGIQ